MTKPHIFLDLDQTLISAEPAEEYDFKKNEGKAKKFKSHDMDKMYIVFERPGLQEFLDYLFKNFDVSIWTAATKDYALFIIDKIISPPSKRNTRKINFIFFSYHCGYSSKNVDNIKKLSLLWELYGFNQFQKDNTFILDDNTDVCKGQEDNCILVKPFEFNQENSENDKYLKELIPVLENIKKNVSMNKPINELVRNGVESK